MRVHRLHTERVGLILLALTSSGCTVENVLGAPDLPWLWLLVPLAGFLFIGGSLVWWRRRAQLSNWDMHSQPSEPSTRFIWMATVVAAITVMTAFLILNLRVEIDPDQRLLNLRDWAGGTVLGAVLSLLLGLRLAER